MFLLCLNILITTNKTFQILEYSLYYYNLGKEDENNLNFIKCNKIRNHLLETLTRQYTRNLSMRESHSIVKGRTFFVLEGLQKTWATHSKLYWTCFRNYSMARLLLKFPPKDQGEISTELLSTRRHD